MTATAVVLATLVVYQGLLLGVGYWARSRVGSEQGYFIGDRRLGPWVAALSYAAGSSSAWSILGVSGIAFSQGVGSVWIIPGTLSGHLFVWFYLAPRLRQLSHEKNWLTLTDLLAYQLKSVAARLTYRLSAVVILFCFTFYIAAQFQGAANTFSATFGFDFTVALLLGVLVVLAYTLWGGFWAVSLTDALQACLMLVAALLLPVAALVAIIAEAPDGWTLPAAAASGSASAATYWHWLGGHAGWFAVGGLLGMFSIGFGPLGQPHLLNRIMALQHPRDIKIARRVALSWFVVVLCGMYVLGLCAHVALNAQQVPAEMVFFAMAEQLLPAVFNGILVAAVLSAIMSTADSQLLVAGAAIQHDLQQARSQRQRPGRKNHHSRAAVALVAAGACLLALWLPDSIFSRVLFAWQALGAAFGPIVVVRLLGWQVRDWSVPTALLSGFGLTVLFYSLPDGPGDLWERAVPFVVAFAILYWARRSDLQLR